MNRPIILAHGIARFDEVLRRIGVEFYFKKIPEHLETEGFRVYRSSVSFAGSVEQRAGELKNEVERILGWAKADKAHIIAHSMGGLDARHMIVDLGMADRVESLTTIGTPHHGTSFADEGLEKGDELIDVIGRMGISFEGFRDLSTGACRDFNQHAADAEATNSVRYQVYSSFQARPAVFTPLKLSWAIIDGNEGKNDGLVPVSSQEWTASITSKDGVTKEVTQRRFGFEADHLNQTGLWDISELRRLNWNARAYERRVRDVYLEIARDVAVPTDA